MAVRLQWLEQLHLSLCRIGVIFVRACLLVKTNGRSEVVVERRKRNCVGEEIVVG